MKTVTRHGIKRIVGFSGGIDSQATARWVLNRYPKDSVILVNSNAGGNEAPITTAFIEEYSTKVHPVVMINPIVADMWKTQGAAEERGYDGSAPLDWPTMIKIKGRPPSRMAQFCTEKLKLIPQRRWIAENFGPSGKFAGWDYVRYSGVRRDESAARKEQAIESWDEWYDCKLICPTADWTKQMCFDYIRAHGEEVNPLYKLGFNRVGCAPCINAGRQDIRAWVARFPAMIDKVRSWEQETGRTFFHPMVPGKHTNTIDDVVAWALSAPRTLKQDLTVLQERPNCESKYGLCE